MLYYFDMQQTISRKKIGEERIFTKKIRGPYCIRRRKRTSRRSTRTYKTNIAWPNQDGPEPSKLPKINISAAPILASREPILAHPFSSRCAPRRCLEVFTRSLKGEKKNSMVSRGSYQEPTGGKEQHRSTERGGRARYKHEHRLFSSLAT